MELFTKQKILDKLSHIQIGSATDDPDKRAQIVACLEFWNESDSLELNVSLDDDFINNLHKALQTDCEKLRVIYYWFYNTTNGRLTRERKREKLQGEIRFSYQEINAINSAKEADDLSSEISDKLEAAGLIGDEVTKVIDNIKKSRKQLANIKEKEQIYERN